MLQRNLIHIYDLSSYYILKSQEASWWHHNLKLFMLLYSFLSHQFLFFFIHTYFFIHVISQNLTY